MIVYEVFYNNGYQYPNYAVWCEGGYPTFAEAKNHQSWYGTSMYERIDRVEYNVDGIEINRQKGIDKYPKMWYNNSTKRERKKQNESKRKSLH